MVGMCAKSLQSCLTFCDKAPLSLGFSKQEYWSGLPCPPPGDLPDPGIEPTSPALQADSEPLWWACLSYFPNKSTMFMYISSTYILKNTNRHFVEK